MKSKTLIYPIFTLLLAIAAGCSKEAAIKPDEVKLGYSLPQGNHSYDTQIVDFYRTYGCYILYKFNDQDFKWNITSNIPYVADQGDEKYIAQSLEALDKYLFSSYPTNFLKTALPYKIILSARIREVNPFLDTLDAPVNSVRTSSHFAFGRAGSSLATMTADELKLMRTDLHKAFWGQAVNLNKVLLPPAFVAVTNYADVFSWNKAQYGVFMSDDDYSQDAYGDFLGYIEAIVSNTPEELEQSLFLPQNDPAGKYRLKYNIIITYYKQAYGLDLQTIAKN